MTKTAPRKPAVRKTPVARKPALAKAAFKPEKKLKKEKKAESKVKVVRDSFTMPQEDYELIAALKQKALKSGLHVKKSELLRASLQALSKLTAAQLKRAISGLEKIKTGRPKKA
jgi:translation initiation factor IF-3